ncbi:lipid kinase [Pokkaliibacter plantistimulans]|uniref:Lipid kinase n=1 Tax=Pokkaliibacter plantistimulans TaxID=1635171 RepID=A0ABX5M0R0_9GAMM|nr:putative urea ABC transporter substrate-binding protein [Pokkaliibacter plantistimulans]PXF31263.1 lipid kinase [Pokkaliibacter plantistimulans]
MKRLTALFVSTALAAVCSAPLLSSSAQADTKKDFNVCWSIYVGWMPWGYMKDHGIIKKWADKYGISIDVTQINDYVESINQYTAGGFDACAMTNMDALTIPAAGGVDSTALIVGDFSNGNDGVVLKGKDKLTDIKGQNVNLVELSVSHYLLARALETVGMKESDVTVVNTSDADMVAAYSTPDVTATVTWNPLLSTITQMPDSHLVFDSSKIPGEIIDLMVANTQTLKDNPDFGKALVGAWYETMALMSDPGPDGQAAREAMATASGTDLFGFESQLETTRMFYTPQAALGLTRDAELKATMQHVAEFSYEHGLLGDGAPNAGFIGVETPTGIYGSDSNVKLRFDPTYMQMAADKQL